MFALVKNTMKSSQGSALVIALLVIMSLSILAAGFAMVTNTETSISGMQKSETKAFYIAQTAIDRSVKQLTENPGWRDGYTAAKYEGGKYDVEVFDSTDNGIGTFDPNLPDNYVRIVATSDLNGVKKEIEALWVNPLTAFNYAYSSGDQVELHNHGTPSAVVTADIHNNAWNGGVINLNEGTTVYGNVTSVGDIVVGTPKDGSAAIVYGNVWGDNIAITTNSRVEKYFNLSEITEGRDLNGDSDALDTGLSKGLADVTGATAINSGGTNLNNGDADGRVASGTVPVSVGGALPATIIDPRPDFGVYYDLVTGSMAYPAGANHVITPIDGDGDGHYFASATAFTSWLTTQGTTNVTCWQCAGDGLVDPTNTVVCPTCGGTGQDQAVVVTGVFYVDDANLDLSAYPSNILMHGSLVVAEGDPNGWPMKTVNIPGGTYDIPHFPTSGTFKMKGASRKHFTQTYRSSNGTYQWNTREIYTGADVQYLPIMEPTDGTFMRQFPSVITPLKIDIHPRETGSSFYQADIGEEMVTIVQGVMYAEGEVHMHGKGGGKTTNFDETKNRKPGDKVKEKDVGIDLNGDGDTNDKVQVMNITTVPIIPTGGGKFNVDINADAVLEVVTLGGDYNGLFDTNGWEYPILLYHEGILLGQKLHTCEHYGILFDPEIAGSGIPFGFDVKFGSTSYQGIVAWRENTTE
ncbi:MAG: hypothetical protein ACE5EO_09190 [Candidatus Krumholzibacteriia bacterium]